MENLNNHENWMTSLSRAMLAIIILLILITLLGGCTITKEQPQDKCCKSENKLIVPHDPANE
tara:strand:- start:1533 stop:1718 length:186 start_codon:yes stop_codon:yes gene_type:complete